MDPNLNISENELELIENYLDESIGEEDLKIFKSRLETDPKFAHRVEEVKELIQGIETASLKDKLEDFHSTIPAEIEDSSNLDSKVKNLRPALMRFMVAASLITFGIFWYVNQNSSPSQLFDDHFYPDPGLPTTMSTQSNYDFFNAMVDYKEGDYKVAIKKWELLLANDPNNDTLNYFLGVSHLAQNEEQIAIKYLETVINGTENTFIGEANFYQGLAYLKEQNLEKATYFLEKSNQIEAREVLDELNQKE